MVTTRTTFAVAIAALFGLSGCIAGGGGGGGGNFAEDTARLDVNNDRNGDGQVSDDELVLNAGGNDLNAAQRGELEQDIEN